jgi:hypothetical protein
LSKITQEENNSLKAYNASNELLKELENENERQFSIELNNQKYKKKPKDPYLVPNPGNYKYNTNPTNMIEAIANIKYTKDEEEAIKQISDTNEELKKFFVIICRRYSKTDNFNIVNCIQYFYKKYQDLDKILRNIKINNNLYGQLKINKLDYNTLDFLLFIYNLKDDNIFYLAYIEELLDDYKIENIVKIYNYYVFIIDIYKLIIINNFIDFNYNNFYTYLKAYYSYLKNIQKINEKTKNKNINNKHIIDFDKNQFIKFLKSYKNIKIDTKIEKNLKNISNGTMISKIHDLNTNLNTNLNKYIDSYKKILKIFLIKDGYNEIKLNIFLDKKSINSLSTIKDFNNIQHFKKIKKNNKYKFFQNINKSIYLLKCFIIICNRLKKSNLNTCIQEYIDKYEKLIKLKILKYDNEDYDYIDYILFIYENDNINFFKNKKQIKSDFNMKIYNYYVYIINIYINTKIKNLELFNPINFYKYYIKWFKEFFYAKRSVSMLNNDLFITFLNNKTDELESKTFKK